VTTVPAPDPEGPPPADGGLSALARFDAAVDRVFAPLRGRPEVDVPAAVLSNLADYGLVWVLLAGVKARRRGPTRTRVRRLLAVAGVSSSAVNTAVKRAVGRERPVGPGVPGSLAVRSPRSASFPSGHTLAAFCTAVVLADSPGERAAYLGFASTVAVSRIHLGAHHASDVVGGAAIGLVLGTMTRRLAVLAFGPGPAGRSA
jgi:undecaprenyl-diphosphatase